MAPHASPTSHFLIQRDALRLTRPAKEFRSRSVNHTITLAYDKRFEPPDTAASSESHANNSFA